mgnify:CR=1 FL=1
MLLIVVWQAACSLNIWPEYLFPGPIAVLNSLIGSLRNGTLLVSLYTSLRRIVIGFGISLAGGKGRVIGTMFGCIFLITLFNGFSQLGVDPFVQDVLKGVALVIAITLDVVRNRQKD